MVDRWFILCLSTFNVTISISFFRKKKLCLHCFGSLLCKNSFVLAKKLKIHLTCPGRPSSSSTRATGPLWAASPWLAAAWRSTLHERPLRLGSQRLWATKLSFTRARWLFQKRERAAACSALTLPPPCFLVWAVRKASSWAWSMSAAAIDWETEEEIMRRKRFNTQLESFYYSSGTQRHLWKGQQMMTPLLYVRPAKDQFIFIKTRYVKPYILKEGTLSLYHDCTQYSMFPSRFIWKPHVTKVRLNSWCLGAF